MATSEPLVPKGQPKGERQRTVQNMQRAGIPLAPRTGQTPAPARPQSPQGPSGSGPVSPPGGGNPVTRVLSENTPADFPFLSEPGQADTGLQESTEPSSTMGALAQSSQSSFGAAVLSRLIARRRGV